jgi:O-antigen ligase
LVALIGALLIVAVSVTEVGVFLPLVILAVAYMVWSFTRPVVAVVTIILMHAYVFEQSADISILELAIGVYMYSYLAFWFAHRWLFSRTPFIRTTSDRFLILFLVLCVVSVVMILVRSASVEFWFRECLALSSLLLTFPAREAMRTEKGLAAVFFAFALLVGTLAIVNLVQYRASSLAANYFWEITSSRKPFGSALYSGLAVGAASLYAHASSWRMRTAAIVLSVAGAMALGTTFYRGFWIAAAIGVTALFIMVSGRIRVRLLWTVLFGGVAVAGIGFVMFGDLLGFIAQAFWSRLASSGTAMADVSVTNRLAESRSVLAMAVDSPLVGHGIGVAFNHFNIITRTTQILMYVHNAYVYLFLKVGIIGLLVFMGYMGFAIRDAVRISRAAAVSSLRLAMVRAALGMFLGYVFVATNSGILQDKQVLLVMILGTAVIASCVKESPSR